MHLPDILDSATAATTSGIAAAGIGYALRRVRNVLEDRTAPLLGVTAAFVFAAQMVNFPIGGGVSGHLIGGALAAILLGPWGGAVAIAVVLTIQCLLFQDGGLSSLGANIVNMALVGSTVAYCVHAAVRRWITGSIGIVIGAVLSSWASVLLASLCCAVELSASGHFAWGPTLSAILLVHVGIGVVEALATGLVVAFLVKTRPDLLDAPAARVRDGLAPVVVAGLACALLTAIFLAPVASSLPDGLEWSLSRLGFPAGSSVALMPGLIPDYEIPGMHGLAIATSLAGVVGTVVVFGIAWSLARSAGLTSNTGEPADAG